MKIFFTTFRDCYFETDTEKMVGCKPTELVRYLDAIYSNYEQFMNSFINAKKNILLNGYPDENIIGLKEVNEIDYLKTINFFDSITEMYIEMKKLNMKKIQKQLDTLQKINKSINNYLKKADPSKPIEWFSFISSKAITKGITEKQFEYIFSLIYEFETFKVFDNSSVDIILTTNQLNNIISDLEIHISSLELEIAPLVSNKLNKY